MRLLTPAAALITISAVLVGCQTTSTPPVTSDEDTDGGSEAYAELLARNALELPVVLNLAATDCRWRFEPKNGGALNWSPLSQDMTISIGREQVRYPIALQCNDAAVFPLHYKFYPRETSASVTQGLVASPLLMMTGVQKSPQVFMDYETPLRVQLVPRNFGSGEAKDAAFSGYRRELEKQETKQLVQIDEGGGRGEDAYEEKQAIVTRFDEVRGKLDQFYAEATIGGPMVMKSNPVGSGRTMLNVKPLQTKVEPKPRPSSNPNTPNLTEGFRALP